MAAPFKRTRLWVDSAFQLRLLLRMGFYFVLYVFLVAHLGFLWEMMRFVLTAGAHKPTLQMYTEYLWKHQHLLFGLVVIAPVLIYDLIKFSHRIAGPLYRCRRVMGEMAGGKAVPEFKPRKHDLMPELFEAFNALIQEWNKRADANPDGQPEAVNPAEMAAKAVTPSSAITAHEGAGARSSF